MQQVDVCAFANDDDALAEILESIEKSRDLLRQVAEQENSEHSPSRDVRLTAEQNIFLDALERDDVDTLKQIIESMSVGVDEQKMATDRVCMQF